MRLVAAVLLVLLGAAIGHFGPHVARLGLRESQGWDRTAHDRSVEARQSLWAISKLPADIVMVGDSLTAGADWRELTGCQAIANRGIPGDFAWSLRRRLSDVLDLKPQAAFLLIGVNDLNTGASPAETARHIASIAEELSASIPAVYVIELLPVSATRDRAAAANEKIAATNALLRQSLSNLVRITLDEDSFAEDGLHLNALGYAKWREEIAPLIAKHCRSN